MAEPEEYWKNSPGSGMTSLPPDGAIIMFIIPITSRLP